MQTHSRAGSACGRVRGRRKPALARASTLRHPRPRVSRSDVMAEATKPVTELPTWKGLSAHSQKVGRLHLRELFAQDHKRGERLTAEAAGLFLDYSKNRITDETLTLLLQLADQSGLKARIDAMFRGDKINVTENRAVLHIALRAPRGEKILVDGENVVPQVHAVLDKMTGFSQRV